MGEHVGPGFVGGRLPIPEANIVTEERFFGKNLVSQVDHLLIGKRRPSVIGEVD